MKENPANTIKDTMWKFLMDKGQKSNIPALKEYVYDLIQMTTQKNSRSEKCKRPYKLGRTRYDNYEHCD